MIKIKNLTIKNFMSVGNATQTINFDRNDLTLVLGENLDSGGNGSKNGSGKTTILNALSYSLFGTALTEIKLNNLVNKSNEKNMLVSVEFEINNVDYRIVRGRKPNILKLFKNDMDMDEGLQQGENKDTQKEINEILNLSHDMFKHIVALNTYTTPFLSERANDQRLIIEQLLGITVLSEKSEKLKAINKETKDSIKKEEFRIDAINKANSHLKDQIKSLELRQKLWKQKNIEKVTELKSAIETLNSIDIQSEIQAHKTNAEHKIEIDSKNALEIAEVEKANRESEEKYRQNLSEIEKYKTVYDECTRWITRLTKENESHNTRIKILQKDIELLNDNVCHACGQEVHDDHLEEKKSEKEKELMKIQENINSNIEQIKSYEKSIEELGKKPETPTKPSPRQPNIIEVALIKTFYNSVDEAHQHKSSLELLQSQLESALDDIDPYEDQITEMKEKGIQEIDFNIMNDLNRKQEHEAFLLKLLTNKDSFVRKKIIEQNLAYLNNRLTHYLREINLPHQIRFMPDLSVEITDLGRELDFYNLSRGERNRLILSLSWAFRDVWESLYNSINLLFIDELIDNGMDASGVESAIKTMKSMARDRNKSVWLVSHREELISRVHNTIKVVKSGGFTEYYNDE